MAKVMQAVDTSWADELCKRKRKRGKLPEGYKEALVNDVESWVKENKRFHDLDEDKERERLIKLRFEQDDREALEYHWRKNEKVIVTADYNEKGKIASVRLDLKPAEIADMINKEGELLPAGSASISDMRDIIIDAVREDHYITAEDLHSFGRLARSHDFDEGHPVARIMCVYEKVKGHLRKDRKPDSYDFDDPKHCLEALADAGKTISWNDLFSHNDGPDRRFQTRVDNERSLAVVAAAVRTLSRKLKDLSLGPVEGHAVVENSTGEVVTSRVGLCVCRTKKRAEELAKHWNQNTSDDNMPVQRTYGVKKVRVSVEKGVEIL